jgi:hypothetical protein
VPVVAVGAVGIPVKLGEVIVALDKISAVLIVMLLVLLFTLLVNVVILFVF